MVSSSSAVVMLIAAAMCCGAAAPTPTVAAGCHATDENYTTAFLVFSYVDASGRLHSQGSEAAKFGDGQVRDATGLLVSVNDACIEDRIKPAAQPWIALARRGGCNFQTKVHHAAAANASAIIVYNDRNSSNLEKMILTKKGANISAVFTYKWKGEQLARLLDNGTRIFANISIANFCTRPYSRINRTSVLFVSISFVVLMLISLAWLVFYYIQRYRNIHAKDQLSRRLCSAAKKALSQIPTKQIRTDDKELEGDGECCAICIEPFKVTEILRMLPCSHEFHRFCIDPWLLEHRTCPMCKMDILKHYGFVFTGSQESILNMDAEETMSESETLQARNVGQISSEQEISNINQQPSDTILECTQTLVNMPTGPAIETNSTHSDQSSEELLSKTEATTSVEIIEPEIISS